VPLLVLPFPTRQYRLVVEMYAADGSDGSIVGRRRGGFRFALAGLEAGVVGAFVLLAWLMIGSLLSGRSVWSMPNLFATTFYGGGVYRNHLLRASWAGVALIFALYGIMGGVWGAIWKDKSRRWLWLWGAVAGVGIYFLFFDVLWKYVNPLILAYAPVRQLQIAHVLWGILLARSPMYARRIEHSVSPAPPASGRPESQEAEPAVRSGEVIL
jgi:hypothetical protein